MTTTPTPASQPTPAPTDALKLIRDTARFDTTPSGAAYYRMAENALAAYECRNAVESPSPARTYRYEFTEWNGHSWPSYQPLKVTTDEEAIKLCGDESRYKWRKVASPARSDMPDTERPKQLTEIWRKQGKNGDIVIGPKPQGDGWVAFTIPGFAPYQGNWPDFGALDGQAITSSDTVPVERNVLLKLTNLGRRYFSGLLAERTPSSDSLREAFDAAFLSWNGFHTKAELDAEWAHGTLAGEMFRAGTALARRATAGTTAPAPEEK